MKKNPPQYALRFLRWFCREDYLEEIEGDLTELFEKQAGQASRRASWTFFWRVIRYFRPDFIKAFEADNPLIHTGMIKHNFLITYRGFLRNKMSFLINLTGLSTGLACALLIFLWVQNEISVDKFHANDSTLFQVMQEYQMPDGLHMGDWAPGPLAAALTAEIPEVKYATAYKTHSVLGGIITLEDHHLRAIPMYIDQNYLKVFSFPLLHGDKNRVVSDRYSAVISEKIALTLFSSTAEAIGKTITWEKKAGEIEDISRPLIVTGVFNNIPTQSTEQFDVMLSLDFYIENSPGVKLWSNDQATAAVVLAAGADIPSVEQKMAKLAQSKRASQNKFRLKQYSSKYLYNNYENGVQSGGRITYVWLFSVIALLILIIASINFMNLSTARASLRVKEIGVKKTLGASRWSLIFQFISESLIISLLALIAALVLVSFFLPHFNELTGTQLEVRFSADLLLAFLGITLLTGLFSSTYPALYLSGFNPVQILKGKLNISWGEIWTRKGLVIFQFAISVVLIVSVLVVYRQMTYVQTKNLGFSKDHILTLKNEGGLEANIETFLAEVRKLPEVIQASNSNHKLVGAENWTTGIDWEGRGEEDRLVINPIITNYHFIETFGITIKEGRSFSPEFGTDTSKVVLNEAAVRSMKLENPLGQTITFWGDKVEIVGIAKDFNFQSLYKKVEPCLIKMYGKHDNIGEHIWIKMNAGQEKKAIAAIADLYDEFNPGYAFVYGFVDDDYQALYESENRVSALSAYFAGLAILISCLGLFGLAAFTAERRTKEIGIRKILGSSVWGIISLLSADFTRMVFVAIVIALPISYLIATRWLEDFVYKIELEWWLFAGAATLALLIALFTVSIQTLKAATINPAECLRDE